MTTAKITAFDCNNPYLITADADMGLATDEPVTYYIELDSCGDIVKAIGWDWTLGFHYDCTDQLKLHGLKCEKIKKYFHELQEARNLPEDPLTLAKNREIEDDIA